MSMIRDALEYIQGLKENKDGIHEIDGRKYWSKNGNLTAAFPPERTSIELSTLDGLIAFIKAEELESKSLVQVYSPIEVRLIGFPDDTWNSRENFATVEPVVNGGFTYDTYMDSEFFIIHLMSNFLETKDRQTILKIVGNLQDEAVRTLADDGVTQVAVVKKGLKAVAAEIKNPVRLKPIRSFPEIEQPESLFVFRMKGGGDGKLPTVALHQVHDGQWQLYCMSMIRRYLLDKMPGLEVVV